MTPYKGSHTDEEIEESFRKAQKARKKQNGFHVCDAILIVGLLILVFNLQVIWDPIFELLRQIHISPLVAGIIAIVALIGYGMLRRLPQKLLLEKKNKKTKNMSSE